ncbi:restriction endonuclease subunit S [Salinimicrobium sp. CDJ15-81-2]|nr:restriction endonuclease subunit S [Salinimicrobium nanhaiense]
MNNLLKIPDGWQEKKLKDILTIGSGRDYKHLDKGDIPVYGTGGYMLSVNDYLYDGESVGIGRKGTIDRPVYLNGKFWTVDTLFYTHSFKQVLPYYVYLIFQSINWKQHNEATGVPSLSKVNIESIKILLPPLSEQQKIAEVLCSVDEKIEVINQQLLVNEELKKGLMQRLFSKGIGHTKFKDSPLGKIPKDWDVKKLGDISDVTAGGTPSTKEKAFWGGSIPWMNSGEINLRRIKVVEGRITEAGLANSSTKPIPTHSVLMALAGQGKTRGKVAINEIEVCTNQSLAAIYNFREAHYEFIFQNLESRYQEIRKMSTGDSGRGGLNLSIIKSIQMAMPPLPEQLKISGVLSTIDEKCENLHLKKNEFQRLRTGLMQQLLTGKIRIKNVVEA